MTEYVNDLVDWLDALPPLLTYTALFVIAYGENVVPPIPGDMAIVFGGYLVGVGQLNFVAVVVLATLGGVFGFMTMYAIGYRVGDAILDPNRLRWIPRDQVATARRWLDKYGYGLVAANRFLSGLRSVISLTVGIAHTVPWKTAVYATISAFVWTVLITYAGYAVGDNWQTVGAFLRDYGRVVVVLIVAAGIVQLVRWRYLKRRGSESDRKDGGNFNPSDG